MKKGGAGGGSCLEPRGGRGGGGRRGAKSQARQLRTHTQSWLVAVPCAARLSPLASLVVLTRPVDPSGHLVDHDHGHRLTVGELLGVRGCARVGGAGPSLRTLDLTVVARRVGARGLRLQHGTTPYNCRRPTTPLDTQGLGIYALQEIAPLAPVDDPPSPPFGIRNLRPTLPRHPLRLPATHHPSPEAYST